MKPIVGLAQAVVSVLALFLAVYSIVRQRREMALSSKLNAAATLLNYYTSKIGSLRDSIIRVTAIGIGVRVQILAGLGAPLAARGGKQNQSPQKLGQPQRLGGA